MDDNIVIFCPGISQEVFEEWFIDHFIKYKVHEHPSNSTFLIFILPKFILTD